jgi:outer membrane protein assembly factor BamB
MHDTRTPICCSPIIADGKVYIGTDDGDFLIFAASKEEKLINTINLGSGIVATPAIADGTIFIATQSHLYAVGAAR